MGLLKSSVMVGSLSLLIGSIGKKLYDKITFDNLRNSIIQSIKSNNVDEIVEYFKNPNDSIKEILLDDEIINLIVVNSTSVLKLLLLNIHIYDISIIDEFFMKLYNNKLLCVFIITTNYTELLGIVYTIINKYKSDETFWNMVFEYRINLTKMDLCINYLKICTNINKNILKQIIDFYNDRNDFWDEICSFIEMNTLLQYEFIINKINDFEYEQMCDKIINMNLSHSQFWIDLVSDRRVTTELFNTIINHRINEFEDDILKQIMDKSINNDKIEVINDILNGNFESDVEEDEQLEEHNNLCLIM